MKTDKKRLEWLPSGAVRFNGELGTSLRKSIRNRLYKIDYKLLVDPFRYRNEDDGGWRCEFWGKNVRGVILSWYLTRDEQLGIIIRDTVKDILSTQTEDGCISSYPEAMQLSGWDIWGRKYVLLGLLRYYELVEQNPAVAAACVRLVEHLRKQIRESGKKLQDFGFHSGMAVSSILDAIAGVYKISGEKKVLDFAAEIVKDGCCNTHNIFKAAGVGISPSLIGNGKAYEMMSCFQGLAALQEFLPDAEWLETDMKFFRTVRDEELFITGVAGLKDPWGEFWYNGAQMQTITDPEITGGLGETCVSVTWLHFCAELLKLTGDASVADAMEATVYNAIPGAADYDFARWIHCNPTPLAGASSKTPTWDQIGFVFNKPFGGNDCCLAQGPEGLAMSCAMAVMESPQDSAWYINWFDAMDTDRFELTGNYPFGSDEMRLTFKCDCAHPLYLRLAKNLQSVNGQPVSGSGYFCLGQTFRKGETFSLEFDTEVRKTELNGWTAYKSGPLVLAQDSRISSVGKSLESDTFRRAEPEEGIRTVFINDCGEKLCDYASAGNLMKPENKLQIWNKTNKK